MLTINEKLCLGNTYIDLQTEYKPKKGLIVGEIFHNGKIIKRVTFRPEPEKVEESVKELHTKLKKMIYEKISSAPKKIDEGFKLRDRVFSLLQEKVRVGKFIYFHLKDSESGFDIYDVKDDIDRKKLANLKSTLAKKFSRYLGKPVRMLINDENRIYVFLFEKKIELTLVMEGSRLGAIMFEIEKIKQELSKIFA